MHVQTEQIEAFRAASFMLARRSMHSKELIARLEKKLFSVEAINHALKELERLGLINDAEFEAYFVKKLQRQGKSRRQIEQKAREKGIPLKQLDHLLVPDDEPLRSLIERKYPVLLDKKAPVKDRQRAVQALLRRGFSISCILKDFNV